MGRGWSRPALAAAALTSIVFVALLVAVLTDARPRLAATNSRVVASGAVLVVPPGQQLCEHGQFLPAETATLRVYAGSAGESTGEPLRFSIADADTGDVLSRQQVDGDYPLGVLDVPVGPLQRDVTNGDVCIENVGTRPMAFAGNVTSLWPLPPDAVVAGAEEEVRMDLFRANEESLWGLAPAIARRFALFKPEFVRPWLMWAVLALALGGTTAAVLLAAREPQPAANVRLGGER